MSITCPVCGATGISVTERYRSNHPLFTGMNRASCRGCGMVFATPMPNEAALAGFNAGYFENAHGGPSTAPVPVAFYSAINRLRGVHVERYLAQNAIEVSSVLEVGPGGAEFARHWLARHPGNDYFAIESDLTCHDRLRALGVRLIGGPDGQSMESSFDLVVISHVLEHVPDPIGFLIAVTSRLRRGGVLFIEVPCRDFEHKSVDEPHLLFFDKMPMALLLERVGFVKQQLSYHGQEITKLRRHQLACRVRDVLRSRLLALGIVAPFASSAPGLESVENPLERAAVRPFEAHVEQVRPSWWLRAVAVKQ